MPHADWHDPHGRLFLATGSMVEDGVSFALTPKGQLSSNEIQATYTAVAQGVCSFTVTVLLGRM